MNRVSYFWIFQSKTKVWWNVDTVSVWRVEVCPLSKIFHYKKKNTLYLTLSFTHSCVIVNWHLQICRYPLDSITYKVEVLSYDSKFESLLRWSSRVLVTDKGHHHFFTVSVGYALNWIEYFSIVSRPDQFPLLTRVLFNLNKRVDLWLSHCNQSPCHTKLI